MSQQIVKNDDWVNIGPNINLQAKNESKIINIKTTRNMENQMTKSKSQSFLNENQFVPQNDFKNLNF